ncbi:hypothetical protein SAMN05421540_1352 [Psychroflexus halocasei]|uniref:Uncharacterized protein n=1 Tax=Psychroflexus halocasei TaxID=908615 RepID=A0A1H4E8W5_9FLAO|nr:hypothetical protein SAMN05421540_1352 [Psychroflexus halocasei]
MRDRCQIFQKNKIKNIQLKSFANGELNLKKNSIEFNDKSSRTGKWLFKLLPFLFLFLGIRLIYSGITNEHNIQIFLELLSGILFLLIPLGLFYGTNFKWTNRKKISIDEIDNVKIKKIFGNIFVDFKLKDNSTRRVYNIKDLADWIVIRNYLTERKVNCPN